VFKRKYFARLDRVGVESIQRQLMQFEKLGKDVVLLCYEDVRKGENDWCHRVMFAEWYLQQTGEIIEELTDPSIPATPKAPKTSPKDDNSDNIQLSLFEQLGYAY
jgi:hypothetical protein